MARRLLALSGVAALVITACGGGTTTSNPPSSVSSPGGGGASASTGGGASASAGGGASASAGGGGSLEGTEVTVFGAFRDAEGAAFEAAFKPFEDATGVDVVYEGSGEFETLINTRVQGGDPPDVAALPQPGLMQRFAAAGNLVALPDNISTAVDTNYSEGWRQFGTAEDGELYGVFHRVNVKSLVFYPKPAFEAAGYQVPTTWDELTDLTDQMITDGTPPWCIGIESQDATGWVATDWIEDFMLRTAGPDVYDQWVSHEIPFNDPAVLEAATMVGEIWLDDAQVFGGTDTILTTPFQEAADPMFEDPPDCWLNRQGNFATGLFPDEVQEDLDARVGVFGLPGINEEFGTPVLGGGDQFVAFEDRPEVMAFLEFLTTGASGTEWARLGGGIFPHIDQDLSAYSSEIERGAAQLLVDAEVFRFDASDLMPAEVGIGSFWTEMVNWVNGAPLDGALANIEATWPTE